MLQIQHDFRKIGHFVWVYLREAHPTDEWNLFKEVCWRQPKILQERLDVAAKFKEAIAQQAQECGLEGPDIFVVDLMEDEALKSYSSGPERLYVVHEQRIVYKGGTGPDHYHPEEVREWLAAYERASM